MYVESLAAGDSWGVGAGFYYTYVPTGQKYDLGPVFSESGGANRIYSWRTGKELQRAISALDTPGPDAVSGEDIMKLVRSGKDFDLNFTGGPDVIPTGETVWDRTSSFDNGHEVLLHKTVRRDRGAGLFSPYHFFTPTVDVLANAPGYWRYTGPLYAAPHPSGIGYSPSLPGGSYYFNQDVFELSSSRRNELYSLGNRAISQARPDRPSASLSVFLGELKRIPSLPLALLLHRGSARNLGSEYLNVQFGIRPFINDLKRMAQSLLKANELLAQYVRDAENVVHRSRTLSDFERDLDLEVYTSGSNNGAIGFNGGVPGFFDTSAMATQFTRRINGWVKFSGAFTYYLPEATSLLDKASRWSKLADRLLGSSLSYEAVWELAPWSWLVDWFIDLQSFIGRTEALASDSLLLRYGYITILEEFVYTWSVAGVRSYSGSVLPVAVTEVRHKRYQRIRSTPYGFSASVDLTGQQWAILAALGMTRAPRSWRINS